jgi:hypothetical protein
LLLHEQSPDNLGVSFKSSPPQTAKVLAPPRQPVNHCEPVLATDGVCLMGKMLVDLWALGAAIVIVGIVAAAVAHRLAIHPIGRNETR